MAEVWTDLTPIIPSIPAKQRFHIFTAVLPAGMKSRRSRTRGGGFSGASQRQQPVRHGKIDHKRHRVHNGGDERRGHDGRVHPAGLCNERQHAADGFATITVHSIVSATVRATISLPG